MVTTMPWLSPNILPLSHDLAVVEVVAAPVIVVVIVVTQSADPTCRNDAGRTVLHHDSGDIRRAPSPPATHV